MGGLLSLRRGIRAAGPLREVLSRIALVDHHAHGILRAPPQSLGEFRGLFSESLDPRQWPHVANGIAYRRAVLGCAPEEQAVYERRLASDPAAYAAALLRATNTELLLVDDGYPEHGVATSWDELGELAGCRARPVLRLETRGDHAAAEAATARERGFPFVREAGWLAHVYANVWFDVSLTIPHVARPDAARKPELYFLAATWWRDALAAVRPELLPQEECEQAARLILRENALALYGA